MIPAIDFSALKTYSTVFKVYIWAKRFRMIALRLLFLGFFTWLFYGILSGSDTSSSYEGGVSFDLGVLLFIWFGLNYFLLHWMNAHWQRFAKMNGFSITRQLERMTVPSFKGKRLRVSLPPIEGKFSEYNFGFFTRMYKEGGILRWRERKMDSIMWVGLPKSVPHIVIDSRFNEQARRSNLSRRYDRSQLLHFEGATGDKYFVYAASGNAIPALQLFTPDVLNVLYAHLPAVDIEVKGRTVWFVWRYAVLDDNIAAALFAAVDMFMAEFSKQLGPASFTDAELKAELTT